MDEVWARVGLVVAALVVAGAIVYLQRRRLRIPERDVEAPQLAAGLYLFTSATCSTCQAAREKLIARVGDEGFEEFLWEHDRRIFDDLEIDAVPAVLVMKETGRGRVYPGRVEKALANR